MANPDRSPSAGGPSGPILVGTSVEVAPASGAPVPKSIVRWNLLLICVNCGLLVAIISGWVAPLNVISLQFIIGGTASAVLGAGFAVYSLMTGTDAEDILRSLLGRPQLADIAEAFLTIRRNAGLFVVLVAVLTFMPDAMSLDRGSKLPDVDVCRDNQFQLNVVDGILNSPAGFEVQSPDLLTPPLPTGEFRCNAAYALRRTYYRIRVRSNLFWQASDVRLQLSVQPALAADPAGRPVSVGLFAVVADPTLNLQLDALRQSHGAPTDVTLNWPGLRVSKDVFVSLVHDAGKREPFRLVAKLVVGKTQIDDAILNDTTDAWQR